MDNSQKTLILLENAGQFNSYLESRVCTTEQKKYYLYINYADSYLL